jgi:thiamine-monophosphate kinase
MLEKELHLRDVGEAGLLARIFERLPEGGAGVRLGPGDDAAVLAGSGDDAVAFASDAMAEGIHFDLAFMTPADVGWRLTCANLSDLAAMGAEPWAAVISAAAPAATPVAAMESFFEGAAELAAREKLALVGGDVVASTGLLFFAMAILGRAPGGKVLTRGGAKPGDSLCVSGELGLAQAGLHILTGEGECRPSAASAATARYRRPAPRLELGRLLRDHAPSAAVIDTSDSLAESVAHLARASAVGIRVEAASLPVAEAARDVAASRGEDAAAYATAAGEDFELLFSCSEAEVAAFTRAAAEKRIKVSSIGVVTEEAKGVVLARDGDAAPLSPPGFSHF